MTGVFLRSTAVTRGWNGHSINSAHKVNSGEETSPAAPAGIRTRNLSMTSPVLLPTSYPGYAHLVALVMRHLELVIMNSLEPQAAEVGKFVVASGGGHWLCL